jgi:salicylate hydroxylase
VNDEVLIAGGGIGGLAAALALTRVGRRVRLFEQAAEWGEIGAGVQLGPNVTRLLRDWGLERALAEIAAVPRQLTVSRMGDGAPLARMRLGQRMRTRYGAPYLTVHRADLHAVLLKAVRACGAELQLGQRIEQISQTPETVQMTLQDGRVVQGGALIGADGVWSRVREQVLGDGPARPSGHLAYRALVAQTDLPAALRSRDVSIWLGPHAHVVAYPVRRGEWLNIVAVVEGAPSAPLQDWDQHAEGAELRSVLGRVGPGLESLARSPETWRLWPLHARPPLAAAGEMARGRVALLGDAAHPMLPYLAQGAAMAIEDAAELGRVLASDRAVDLPSGLQQYAQARWQRCARVQKRARRNGVIFHATGPLRWGRDLSLRLFGERLLDLPWLYRSDG